MRARQAVERRSQRESGAVQSRSTIRGQLAAWLLHHRLVAIDALQRLLQTPVASLVTCLVVGIALALPAGLFLGLDNMQRLTTGWDGAARISLFLKDSVTEKMGRNLVQQLSSRPEIDEAVYISRSQALEEFRRVSGFGDLLEALPANPLPAVVVLTPATDPSDTGVLENLLLELEQMDAVELVQLDLQWVRRLHALLGLGRELTLALALILGLGVLLVTGNTIRLAIEARRDEIVVVKLVGGTDAYVRRPFLYTGFWYGLGGSLMACLLLGILLIGLKKPVSVVSELYGSEFALQGFNFGDVLSLLVGGALLGLGGARLAVSRHLGEIAPR